MDLGIPPLRIKNMLESKPGNSSFLVRALTVLRGWWKGGLRGVPTHFLETQKHNNTSQNNNI